MLLTSVIVVLQETLEAAILFSLLAVISLHHGQRLRWFAWGLVAGLALAITYAINMEAVSEWFDYVGQEVVNAGLQAGIFFALLLLSLIFDSKRPATEPGTESAARQSWLGVLCAVVITLAITREGAEILLFLSGFHGEQAQAVLAGGTIGFGIGASLGCLAFYLLLACNGPAGRVLMLCLLALFAGNMLSQASLQLIQADWLPAGAPLWNSSALLPEESIPGRLLYAIAGYESRPSAIQVGAYITGAVSVLVAHTISRKTV